YELCEDSWREGVCYVEIRFAPQLHVHPGLPLAEVVRAVARGLKRAEQDFARDERVVKGTFPAFRGSLILCAMRMFRREFSEGYGFYFESCGYSPPEEVYARASLDLARAAAHFKDVEGLPVTGLDL